MTQLSNRLPALLSTTVWLLNSLIDYQHYIKLTGTQFYGLAYTAHIRRIVILLLLWYAAEWKWHLSRTLLTNHLLQLLKLVFLLQLHRVTLTRIVQVASLAYWTLTRLWLQYNNKYNNSNHNIIITTFNIFSTSKQIGVVKYKYNYHFHGKFSTDEILYSLSTLFLKGQLFQQFTMTWSFNQAA